MALITSKLTLKWNVGLSPCVAPDVVVAAPNTSVIPIDPNGTNTVPFEMVDSESKYVCEDGYFYKYTRTKTLHISLALITYGPWVRGECVSLCDSCDDSSSSSSGCCISEGDYCFRITGGVGRFASLVGQNIQATYVNDGEFWVYATFYQQEQPDSEGKWVYLSLSCNGNNAWETTVRVAGTEQNSISGAALYSGAAHTIIPPLECEDPFDSGEITVTFAIPEVIWSITYELVSGECEEDTSSGGIEICDTEIPFTLCLSIENYGGGPGCGGALDCADMCANLQQMVYSGYNTYDAGLGHLWIATGTGEGHCAFRVTLEILALDDGRCFAYLTGYFTTRNGLVTDVINLEGSYILSPEPGYELGPDTYLQFLTPNDGLASAGRYTITAGDCEPSDESSSEPCGDGLTDQGCGQQGWFMTDGIWVPDGLLFCDCGEPVYPPFDSPEGTHTTTWCCPEDSSSSSGDEEDTCQQTEDADGTTCLKAYRRTPSEAGFIGEVVTEGFRWIKFQAECSTIYIISSSGVWSMYDECGGGTFATGNLIANQYQGVAATIGSCYWLQIPNSSLYITCSPPDDCIILEGPGAAWYAPYALTLVLTDLSEVTLVYQPADLKWLGEKDGAQYSLDKSTGLLTITPSVGSPVSGFISWESRCSFSVVIGEEGYTSDWSENPCCDLNDFDETCVDVVVGDDTRSVPVTFTLTLPDESTLEMEYNPFLETWSGSLDDLNATFNLFAELEISCDGGGSISGVVVFDDACSFHKDLGVLSPCMSETGLYTASWDECDCGSSGGSSSDGGSGEGPCESNTCGTAILVAASGSNGGFGAGDCETWFDFQGSENTTYFLTALGGTIDFYGSSCGGVVSSGNASFPLINMVGTHYYFLLPAGVSVAWSL